MVDQEQAGTPASGRLPDFLLIGAPRAGTTALYRFLEQHPEVFVSDPKEPHFLCVAGEELDFRGPGDGLVNEGWVTDEGAYRALFSATAGTTSVGEASTSYLWCDQAPERARVLLGPDVRLIAVLRDPAERAWSTFHYLRREGYEPYDDLLEAMAQEPGRAAAGWSPIWRYLEMGRYAVQLRRWLDVFDRDQLCLHRYEDLREDPDRVLQETLAFLGVQQADGIDAGVQHNLSGAIRWGWLHRALTGDHALKRVARRHAPTGIRNAAVRLGSWNVRPAESMDPHVRAQLIARFEDDVAELEGLLGWDLTAWRR